MKKRLEALKEALNNAAKKLWFISIKPVYQLKGKCLQALLLLGNNDKELGAKIGEAYEKVGSDGVVLMEESDTNETYVEFVDGAQIDSGLKSQHLATDKDKLTCTLDLSLIHISEPTRPY